MIVDTVREPVARGDGSIDDKEEKVLEGIAVWMDVNKEAIFGTRPWKVFGEGPASQGAPINSQGFNEGKGKPFTAEDVRFTSKAGTLYAIVLGVPGKTLSIKSLGAKVGLAQPTVELLGSSASVRWRQHDDALSIEPPSARPVSDAAVVCKITFR